jgi:hypothetical protein
VKASRQGSFDLACPACKGNDVWKVGPLPGFARNSFGGVQVESELSPGCLFHCPNCDLFFRYPYLSEAACLQLYEKLPATV